MPGLIVPERSFYCIENIKISAKTAMGEGHCGRHRILIYQEAPDISGIFFVSLNSEFLHSGFKRLWIYV